MKPLKKTRIQKIKDAIKRWFGFFDSNGLRYSFNTYRYLRYRIITYPDYKKARYANQATVMYVKDSKFLKMAFLPFTEKSEDYIFKQFNAISVANLAYIKINAPLDHYKKKAHNLLSRYEAWLNSKQLIKTI